MDDLLRDFLTETGEHLDTVDSELVRFERDPSDLAILRNVFRLVHTIKGTCGFIGLPRLEALAHAAEGLMGRLRDGAPVTSEAVTLILATVDRIKMILAAIERAAVEPDGTDADIIVHLERASGLAAAAPAQAPIEFPDAAALPPPVAVAPAAPPPAPGPSTPSPHSAPARSTATQTVRVSVDTLEHLMTMVSELVLTRNQLLDLARRAGSDDGFKVPLQRLSHVTGDLQDGIMKTRMQPVGSVWAKLPRVVRDLSEELGKRLDLVMTGAETELDRQILDMIRDPLTHLVRNAADHGIESTADRIRAGKPAQGTIRLDASHEGGTITIEISDDGRGLDLAAIRRRAVALALVPEAELGRMTDEQAASLIFHPGFSTATTISSVSGRGVGMDVVKANIEEIGGTVEIESQAGRGAAFTIKIPLTLAIIAGLIVELGGQRFALPQIAVVELVRVRPGSDHVLERISGSAVLRLRDDLLPIVDLADTLRVPRRGPEDDGFVVVAQVGRQRFGMLVDAVLETEEIVVKPMCARLKSLSTFAGHTIMGDGGVVLIVDPNGIARTVGYDHLRTHADLLPGARRAEEEEPMTLLLFKGTSGAVKAVPLSLVTRLEEVDAGCIEEVGGKPCIQYRGRLMSLLPIAGELRGEGLQPVIVVTQGGQPLGLAVREIVDIVDAVLDIEAVSDRPDLVGSAIVRGRATEIVDLSVYLPRPEQGGVELSRTSESAETVLLVDDNPFFRGMLSPVLKAAGYRVRTAASADEALAILAGGHIRTLVADLDLPGRSGLDLAADLRRDPALRYATVVLLASAPSSDVLDRARSLGVYDVVAKFDRTGLMSTLAEAAGALALAA